MNEPATKWLQAQARAEVAGSRRTAADGRTLLTPDGLDHYGALDRHSGGEPR